MNGESFKQNFKKVYRDNEVPIYVFKAAHGFSMMGVTGINKCMLGMGIAPNTYVGIRICEDDMFYIRFSDSEMQYECKKDNLAGYNGEENIKQLFNALSGICGNIPGAQIYFHCDCAEKEFCEYLQALVYGFCMLTGTAYDMENKYDNFSEKARKKITVSAGENRCEMIENDKITFFSLPLKGCKIIIGKTGGKPFKPINFEETVNRLGIDNYENISDEESAMYKASEGYEILDYAINEKKRIFKAAEALGSGDFSMFSRIIKRSASEYLDIIKKSGGNLRTLYDIASSASIICGIYENSGIYSLVEDYRVDRFIKNIGDAYEHKIGKRPNFYVCASSATCKV